MANEETLGMKNHEKACILCFVGGTWSIYENARYGPGVSGCGAGGVLSPCI